MNRGHFKSFVQSVAVGLYAERATSVPDAVIEAMTDELVARQDTIDWSMLTDITELRLDARLRASGVFLDTTWYEAEEDLAEERRAIAEAIIAALLEDSDGKTAIEKIFAFYERDTDPEQLLRLGFGGNIIAAANAWTSLCWYCAELIGLGAYPSQEIMVEIYKRLVRRRMSAEGLPR